MKKTTSSLLLLLTLLAIAISASADVMEECKAISAGDVPPGPNYYDLCVATLKPLPGSDTADTTALAIMLAKLAIVNATNTIPKIEKLVGEEKGRVKAALEVCTETYSSAIDNVREVIKYVKHKDKYEDAHVMVSSALTDLETCKDEFDSQDEILVDKETNDVESFIHILIRFVVTLKNQKRV